MSYTIYQNRPAEGFLHRWKDASPIGNGECGGLLFGDLHCEHLILTHTALWEQEKVSPPPDCAALLPQIRACMDQEDYKTANGLLQSALQNAGYRSPLATPFPLCELRLLCHHSNDFSAYRRAIHTHRAECEITYRNDQKKVRRRCFFSRADGCLYWEITWEGGADFSIFADFYRTPSPACDRRAAQGNPHTFVEQGILRFCQQATSELLCGCDLKIVETDGTVTAEESALHVRGASKLLLCARAYVQPQPPSMENLPFGASDYDTAMVAHLPLHQTLFFASELSLCESEDVSNEALLNEAFQSVTPLSLLERLWNFGRYLFICGTAEGKLPFPLYGLWAGDYALPWSQHVANENVEIIYWQAAVGGLSVLIRPLIDYYHRLIPHFRENAKNLFGCRGIVVSVYSTPCHGYLSPPVPVILHFTMASGWLCHHFLEYYRFTRDEALLQEKILPFLLETANFIEDYAVLDAQGQLHWYPSVSPENSPAEFQGQTETMSHAMPTTHNATIELALVREVLTDLIALCREKQQYLHRLPRWEALLASIPAYARNDLGAIKEWQWHTHSDYQAHRHLSHVYPLFPGKEISWGASDFPAFAQTIALRQMGALSGWSFAHMAGISARLQDGNELFHYLDRLCKSCLLPNLFTLHNDYRDDGLTLELSEPPVQLDALMGIVHALQQMLLDVCGNCVAFFSALPAQAVRGHAKLNFFDGTAELSWNQAEKEYEVRLTACRDTVFEIDVPHRGGRRRQTVRLEKNESVSLLLEG